MTATAQHRDYGGSHCRCGHQRVWHGSAHCTGTNAAGRQCGCQTFRVRREAQHA